MPNFRFIAVSTGNTRTGIARVAGSEIESLTLLDNRDTPAIVASILGELGAPAGASEADVPVVIASVNEDVTSQIESGLHDQMKIETYRIGTDLPIPIGTQLDPETITGVDRLLNAAAAYAALKEACIVVDVGTAVTVDFIDGHGTFHGGAIAPGASMQLAALHDHTEALPDVRFARPEESFGRSTSQAMLHGIYYGIRGLVWKLAERYAEHYGAFPTLVATGGDAATLFEGDELIDRIVPDLTFRGIAETVAAALAADGVAEDGGARLRPTLRDS